MDRSRFIEDAAIKICNEIDRITTKPTDEQLRGVARISCGDDAIGDMIYDTAKAVGEHGGININEYGGIGIKSEVLDGFYLDKGFAAPVLMNDTASLKSVLVDCPVVLLAKPLTRQDELLPILEKVIRNNFQRVLFIADISGDALEQAVVNKLRGTLDIMIVEPPFQDRDIILQDLALYTGGTPYAGDYEKWNMDDHCGRVEKATVTARDTTLIGGHGDKKKLQAEINALKKQEPSEKTNERIARLTGKIANIFVGGATQVERQEVKLRVQDAVGAVRSAQIGGIVPGGGVALRDIAVGPFEYLDIPYETLLENAGITNESILRPEFGFNLRTGKSCHMVKECIVDPAIVIKEAVRNSHSVVSKLITTTIALPFEERI